MEIGLYTFAKTSPDRATGQTVSAGQRLREVIEENAYIADTTQQAADEFFPSYAAMMPRIGRERSWAPTGRQQFDLLRSPRGALAAGSPREVIDKILFQHELFGPQRFLAQMSVGAMPHAKVMRAIELLGTQVAQ